MKPDEIAIELLKSVKSAEHRKRIEDLIESLAPECTSVFDTLHEEIFHPRHAK